MRILQFRAANAPIRAEKIQILSYFEFLIRGAPATVLGQLLRLSDGTGLYHWTPSSCSKWSWSGEVAWPVAWLLASHHRKFIYSSGAKPDRKKFRECLEQWQRKLFWRIGLSDVVRQEGELPQFRSRKKTPICNPGVADVSKELAEHVKRVFWEAFDGDHRQYLGNSFPLVALARRLIKHGPHSFTVTDKDGGFASAETCDLVDARKNLLENSGDYRKVLRSSFITSENALLFKSIVLEVVNDECDAEARPFGATEHLDPRKNRMYGDLTHDFVHEGDFANIVSDLQFTVKTHKPQREVVPRALHSSTRSPTKPLLRWVSWCLRQAIRGFEH